jgi:site-specific recombinase XerD
MSAQAAARACVPVDAAQRDWATLSAQAPQLAATIRRYLIQLGTFLAPRSVDAADFTLRQFAGWLTANTDVTVVANITRTHIEDFKVWLAARPGTKSPTMSKNTQRQRLRMIRIFLERLIEWDWPDAPGRNPILHGDIPPRPEPLPKFLNDQDAAKLMAAARAHRLPRYRLVVEMLARTGLRASELCELAADAVTQIGDAHWLRVPVGKLRNDRFIPLHPDLVVLLAEWTATNAEHIRRQRRLIADEHAPIERRTVHRIVATTARKAGIGHVHPHQLRHTLATQAMGCMPGSTSYRGANSRLTRLSFDFSTASWRAGGDPRMAKTSFVATSSQVQRRGIPTRRVRLDPRASARRYRSHFRSRRCQRGTPTPCWTGRYWSRS